jgi:diguanylate cyclase (GGDEF)-like protein/PAS domain S-box-containing protein
LSGKAPWQHLRRGKHQFAWRLAGCLLFVSLATIFVGLAPQANLIWVANGVLLAYLLLSPRRHWPGYLCAGAGAQLAGVLVVSRHWQAALLPTALNLAEATIGAFLLRGRFSNLPRFTDRRYLIRFGACAVLAAPLATGSIYAWISAVFAHGPFAANLVQWAAADGLGAAVATPACVAIFRCHSRRAFTTRSQWIYFLLPCVAAVPVFLEARAPLEFVLYPLLLLVLLRMGLGWAAMATLFVAAAGSWFTVRGVGPFALSTALSPLEPSVLLQVFLAGAMFMLYSVSIVLEDRLATEHRLQEIASLHTVVTENSRDIIVLSGFDVLPRYISPAVERLTGWSPQETMHKGFTDIVHPDDLPKIQATARSMRDGIDSGILEYRVRRRNGGYVWVESGLRTLNDTRTGVRTGILQMVRDISERKLAERRLQDAYQAVETLAATDALTGLANRRRFDYYLSSEWRRCSRDRWPLSLLLVDVDLFKLYNDAYGHLQGDMCLRQIAAAAREVVCRPGDLVARFGGEEFAVVLPNTSSYGARKVGSALCEGLRSIRIAHKNHPLGIVTASVGCATVTPRLSEDPASLIELADEALYVAKRSGRNRVCNSSRGVERPAAIALGQAGSANPA